MFAAALLRFFLLLTQQLQQLPLLKYARHKETIFYKNNTLTQKGMRFLQEMLVDA